MGEHEEKIEIMRKYLTDMSTGFYCHIGGEVPSKKINNALKTFAQGMDSDTIIGFYDTTSFGSGKNGYIFTDDKMYYVEMFEKPKKLWYDDIKQIRMLKSSKKDSDRELAIDFLDGSSLYIEGGLIKKTPLKNFLNEMKNFEANKKAEKKKIENEKKNNFGAESAGRGIGAFRTVNNQFEEEKFHSRQGHGFAAERANNLFDKLTGHDAKIVGDDNAKNGADRVVDGVNIQSKYCATGKRCINECFENDGKGTFRYMTDGKPMKIEVPSDKYDEAVMAMEEKIKNGQVKGVSDPNEAKNIVKKGHFTYAQAKNIAKAGTVESLTYDAVNGTIIASSAFGVTAMITFATSMWNGEDFEDAIKIATYSGLKVGGTAFITSVLAAQLSKAGLNSALVGSSEAIVAMMGPKASAVLINAFRVGSKPIYGAAAMKAAAKLLRSNTITAGLVGSMVAGSAAGKVTNAVVGSFIEDDADKMVEIIQDVFTEMASEYLLSNKEAEKSVDRLKDKLDGKTLKDMFASNDRKKFARNLLIPIIENQISKREVIHKLTEEQMLYGIREVLEDISDMEESYA